MTAITVAEEPAGTMIDEAYEFSAPHFFDFIRGETEEDTRKAEQWFVNASSHAPSPFMPRIKADRSVKVESLCNFNDVAGQSQKVGHLSNSTSSPPSEEEPRTGGVHGETLDEVAAPKELSANRNLAVEKEAFGQEVKADASCIEDNQSILKGKATSIVTAEVCTPTPHTVARNEKIGVPKQETARKIASILRNSSALKPKSQLQSSNAKSSGKPSTAKKSTAAAKNIPGTPSFAQENQAIKRQKLEGGMTRQILNVKPHNLPHKSKLGISNDNLTTTSNKLERKVYAREPAKPAAPFISTAELLRKFQSSTRDLPLPMAKNSSSHDAAAIVGQMKPKLKLTRPKEPDFETAQRVRSVKVKSTAEIEEEMMAKIPKFKARPVNKKILEAPRLPALPRSAPKAPEFQEFHLQTMERFNHNAETSSSITYADASHRNKEWKPHLTEPKTPTLQTSLRARPTNVKSSVELEQEELEKAPRFKARPLNKKIFESKGELGIFCNAKKHVTVPQEFHFATNERIPLPSTFVDFFDKLSLSSEPRHEQIPRNTTPNPFNLRTEERGAEKEKRFIAEVTLKQWEEERARIRKANPYPYTTDYPVVPPKPEPKSFTKPEPFQLESLVRHEEEMKREMEERMRKEKEEAEMRLFKARPILKEDPIPLPEKLRRPLTQVQEFELHVEHRAVGRAEFDHKIKEKEMMYKRFREESEAARMMEEEKALKQLRRTMVPHARPVPDFAHPFCPHKSSRETTKPRSPNLRILRRKERRNMVHPFAATSSPATFMR